MPTPFEDVTFLARTGKAITGVSGADITLPSSTTAQGLLNAGNITIDAQDATGSSVNMGNSLVAPFQVNVTGDLVATGFVGAPSIAIYSGVNAMSLTAPGLTGPRYITFPNYDGNVLVRNVSSGVVDLNAYNTIYYQLRNSAGTANYRIENPGAGFAQVSVDGPVIMWDAAGPASQAGAIPDPAGGGTVDTEARAAINDILAAIRSSTGIGIIAG